MTISLRKEEKEHILNEKYIPASKISMGNGRLYSILGSYSVPTWFFLVPSPHGRFQNRASESGDSCKVSDERKVEAR